MSPTRSSGTIGAARRDLERLSVWMPRLRRNDMSAFLTSGRQTSLTAEGRRRLSNNICALGLDHALHVANGWGLADFAAQRLARPLTKGEERFNVPASSLPHNLNELGQLRRATIIDKATKKTWIEIIHPPEPVNRLHVVSDRGTVGWQMWFCLCPCLACLGSFQWDEPHKGWTSVNAALDAAGLMPFRLPGNLLNLASGPWQGAAMLGNLGASSRSYFASGATGDPLFQHFYEELAWEGGVEACSWGSTESLEIAYRRTEECPYWHRKGDLVKSCRWFSIFDRLEEFLPWWWAFALQLVHFCMRMYVVKSTAELQSRMAQDIKAAKEAAEVLARCWGRGRRWAARQQADEAWGSRSPAVPEEDGGQLACCHLCSHVQVQQGLGEDHPCCGDPCARTPWQGTETARYKEGWCTEAGHSGQWGLAGRGRGARILDPGPRQAEGHRLQGIC